MAVKMSAAVRAAVASAWNSCFAAGTIRIYSGTRPADTTGATTTLLATVTLQSPAFVDSGSNGILTISDPASVTAVAPGTATWFRMTGTTGTLLVDGTVTATGGGGDLTLGNTAIVSGGTVDITGVGTVTFAGA